MTIFVGMSGGVDSSVSAALLKDRGHDVRGVFIKGWYPEGFPCTWKEDRRDAMRVAAHLGIPFHTLDLSKEYKESVIDYLLSEYQAGHTPNPDILCNKDIKFGHFLSWAKKQGADAIATGHYARTEDGRLFRGKDGNKDQSYFLYTLTSEQLQHVVFPLGDMEKSEVRAIAVAKKIPVAQKRDSQGLCFIGTLDMGEFLSRYIEVSPGKVLNEQGEEIGTHDGAVLYTRHQRHGFTVPIAHEEPLYVLDTDTTKNTITVGPESSLHTKTPDRLALKSISWVTDMHEAQEAQYRYRGARIPIAHIEGNTVYFESQLPETPAEGQSLVLYSGDECVGGGVIVY